MTVVTPNLLAVWREVVGRQTTDAQYLEFTAAKLANAARGDAVIAMMPKKAGNKA